MKVSLNISLKSISNWSILASLTVPGDSASDIRNQKRTALTEKHSYGLFSNPELISSLDQYLASEIHVVNWQISTDHLL